MELKLHSSRLKYLYQNKNNYLIETYNRQNTHPTGVISKKSSITTGPLTYPFFSQAFFLTLNCLETTGRRCMMRTDPDGKLKATQTTANGHSLKHQMETE